MKINKMIRLLSLIGFAGSDDLFNSLLRPQSFSLLINFSVLGSAVQYLFGLNLFAFSALLLLLIVELLSGLLASKLRGRKISSRRLQRFGVMVLIWSTLLLVMTAFANQYSDEVESLPFHYIHTLIVFYIIGVYVKSILENAEVIFKNKMEVKDLINRIFGIFMNNKDKKK